MLLAEAAAVATSDNTYVTVIVAVVAALPGLLGFLYSWRKNRQRKAQIENSVGLGFAQTAFTNMEHEVQRLTRQTEQYDRDRDGWNQDRKTWTQDKGRLLERIGELTEQIHTMNGYLQSLLVILDVNGIKPPRPPAGMHLRQRGR